MKVTIGESSNWNCKEQLEHLKNLKDFTEYQDFCYINKGKRYNSVEKAITIRLKQFIREKSKGWEGAERYLEAALRRNWWNNKRRVKSRQNSLK